MLYGFLVPHPDSAGVVGTCVVCYFVTVGVLSLYLTYFSGENLLLAKRVSSEVCSAPLTVYWLHIVILNHADTQGYAVHTFLSSWSVSYVPQQLTNKCLLVALFQHGTDTLRLMAGKHRYSFTYEVEILITRESTGEARISTATWFVWLEKAAQPRSTNLPPPSLSFLRHNPCRKIYDFFYENGELCTANVLAAVQELLGNFQPVSDKKED